eukprot:Gregarina_sp_Poly_1__2985@NODE_1838_length_3241_cov_40_416194_g1193_i0_p2_GENE_NODE_1838_length_3241_cov_40_416194_g1193_i0NODE_1838_length_3241_cov_40_416194_g1193_i0_p2_ORF_typecomplete_len193_score19_87_NODE_1838_length_3241_cov_40_416194_g1193_i014151993
MVKRLNIPGNDKASVRLGRSFEIDSFMKVLRVQAGRTAGEPSQVDKRLGRLSIEAPEVPVPASLAILEVSASTNPFGKFLQIARVAMPLEFHYATGGRLAWLKWLGMRTEGLSLEAEMRKLPAVQFVMVRVADCKLTDVGEQLFGFVAEIPWESFIDPAGRCPALSGFGSKVEGTYSGRNSHTNGQSGQQVL